MARLIIMILKANASKLLLSLLFLAGFYSSAWAQSRSFPARYQGVWRGTLELWNENSKVDSFPVEFKLLPVAANKFSYYMAYENPKMPLTKFYQLQVIDSVKGYYMLDEGQNLLLPQQEIGGCLFGQIENVGNYISHVLRPEGDALVFELTVASLPSKVPEDKVRKAPVKQLQRVRLFRVKS